MKLHAHHGEGLVADRHDFSAAIGSLSPGGDDKIGVQGIRSDDEAVVAGGSERIRQPAEDSFSVVLDLVGLAMHQALGPNDDPPCCLADGLVTEANTQEGNPPHKRLNALD